MSEVKRARKASKKPAWQRDTVKERVRILFNEAEDSFSEHPERSRKYVEMAVRLCMRYNMTVPAEYRRRFCKACKSYLVPGKSSRVRTSPSQKAVIVTCMECGHVSRHPYRRESSKKGKK